MDDLPSSFGKISLYTYDSDAKEYDSEPLIISARNELLSYTTINNKNYFIDNIANGYGFMHSLETYAPIDSTNYGLKVLPTTL